ncbi:glycosyltransferase family 2 protein [Fusibacter paucivorans]|uniref:Glycosyltransferase family 2 protein n=1 Tax=Fusibacter paucivorans TaxID=76009 RepID=A0ABS5PN40_9FIRM|nr:glycosyltransferase family 2 protein [Fusibacter paucivorans]MBS7526599.1 glycosyltransferase family 2 protein [Fusibacter paucivorans]
MLSIIIVHYKTLKMTSETIRSIQNSKLSSTYEIIVVDNASNDGSVAQLRSEFPEVDFIENDQNDGFAKANNIGIRKAKGEYILLLNSDIALAPDALEKALQYIIKNRNTGILGIRLVLPNGVLDHTCKRGFPTPMSSLYYFMKLHKKYPESKKYGHYTQSFINEEETAIVDAVVGAFMLIPKDVIQKVGLLDESFFMYGEDLDYCYRAHSTGYDIVYYPEARAVHFKGGSGRSLKVTYEFYRAMWLFYKKHYVHTYGLGTTVLVGVGIAVMFLFAALKWFFRRT